MKPHLIAVVLAIVIAPAWPATRTVTLSVPGMNCAACPITVKKALVKVAGVAKVDVSLDRREAVVTFDDTQAGVGQFTRATTEAGYPSTPKEGGR
jgi:mercuric ion binding protein